MNNIMDILVDNYIYVALGSLFLIIVLIGIVVSNNRKRKKAKNPDMVSMSDVRTGSINDVANTLNAQNNAEMPIGMKPLNVAEVHPSTNQTVAEPVAKDLYAPMGSITPVEPIQEVRPVAPVDANPYGTTVRPVMEAEKEPTFEPVFGPQTVEPTPRFVQEIPTTPAVEPIQEIPAAPVLEPIKETPVASAKPEVLDVMDIETPSTTPTEVNPLNGEAPVFQQNNNQNI